MLGGCHPYHLHMSVVMKSGILKLLEPSRLVQVFTRIDLPSRWCATSLKVVGSIPDNVIGIILPAALWPRRFVTLNKWFKAKTVISKF